MSVFHQLPEALCVDILSNWCALTEACKLDSAYSLSKQNIELFRIFSVSNLSLKNSSMNPLGNLNLVNWLCVRSLSVRNLNLQDTFFEEFVKKLNFSNMSLLEITNNQNSKLKTNPSVVSAALNQAKAWKVFVINFF